MKNCPNLLPSLAIMAGLVFAGSMLPVAVREFRAADRVVSVRGLCEREVQADKVIWPIKFKVAGNELGKVYDEIQRNNSEILRFLEAGGISPEDISVSSPSISDKYAQEYGTNDRPFRFVASCTVTVCSSNVSATTALINSQSELIRSGITLQSESWESGTQYLFVGLNELKPEMVQEATRNAREVALKFAEDSGSRLGKIKQASQGVFSIDDIDSSTPLLKKVRVVTNVTYYLNN